MSQGDLDRSGVRVSGGADTAHGAVGTEMQSEPRYESAKGCLVLSVLTGIVFGALVILLLIFGDFK